MSPEERASEELLATMVVHGEMLRALWVFTLIEHSKDPVDDVDACRTLALNDMEKAFDASGEPHVEALRQLAISKMEEMWADITMGVQETIGPVSIVPTAYGRRKADEDRKRKGNQTDADTPDR